MMARVTCPNCQQPFGAPIEQVLDVEVDPAVKSRLLSGQVNMVVCPQCGVAGSLPTPFLYHDPDKELALVLMPMEAGRTDVERQQVIGSLSRAVMNQMPSEQRKSYLLNPQVFFSMDSLIKRVLEAEGITEEMIEEQKAKTDLLRQLMEVEQEEARAEIVRENESLLDEEFFTILYANLNQVEAAGREDIAERLYAVQQSFFENTDLGRRLQQRSETLQTLRENPTREMLVDLLIQSESQETREALIILGQQLIDYFFFQKLTQRMEAMEDEEQRERVQGIRQEVMDVREEMREQLHETIREKEALIERLIATDNLELLARRRLADMDELFFSVLTAELEMARQEGDEERAAQLQEIHEFAMGLMEQMMPPEIALVGKLVEAENEQQARQILEENQKFVSPALVEALAAVQAQLQERGESDAAARLGMALAVARSMAPAAPPQPQQPAQPEPPEQPEPGEKTSPSGLIIG
jgi:hypothetical protein